MLLIPMDGSSATWKLWSRNGNRGDHSPNQSPASTTRQEARQEACYRADVVRFRRFVALWRISALTAALYWFASPGFPIALANVRVRLKTIVSNLQPQSEFVDSLEVL